jgi:GT2 family glycosyltransferase
VNRDRAGRPAGVSCRTALVVLTYLRPDDLAELLPLLEQQIATVGHDACTILVIDNDPAGSAEAVVRHLASPLVRYVHEPAAGIAHARNRALDETVDDELLIFIDDDERPLDGWLAAMLDAYARHRPAGVTGPLFPEYETDPDPWLLAGGFFVRREFADGHRVPAAGSGNLLLDLTQVRRLGLRFDERFGLTGGSDTLFTRQLIARGGAVVFAPRAGVVDKVPASRMTRHWTLRRQYRVGTTWSRTAVELAPAGSRRLWARLRLTAGGGARVGVGALRHALGRATGSLTHQARGSRTLRRGLGMAAGAWGGTITEYHRPAGPTP